MDPLSIIIKATDLDNDDEVLEELRKEPLTAKDIPDVKKIGRKKSERKDVDGIPITPQIAAEVNSTEAKAGHDTGRGSAPARLQSAAAFNVREKIITPEGDVDIGTVRVALHAKAVIEQASTLI